MIIKLSSSLYINTDNIEQIYPNGGGIAVCKMKSGDTVVTGLKIKDLARLIKVEV